MIIILAKMRELSCCVEVFQLYLLSAKVKDKKLCGQHIIIIIRAAPYETTKKYVGHPPNYPVRILYDVTLG